MEKTIIESVLEQMRASRKGGGKPPGPEEAAALRNLACDLVRDLPDHMAPRLEVEISRHLKDALIEVQETIYKAIVGNEPDAGRDADGNRDVEQRFDADRSDGDRVDEPSTAQAMCEETPLPEPPVEADDVQAIDAGASGSSEIPDDDFSFGDSWLAKVDDSGTPIENDVDAGSPPTEGLEDDPTLDGDTGAEEFGSQDFGLQQIGSEDIGSTAPSSSETEDGEGAQVPVEEPFELQTAEDGGEPEPEEMPAEANGPQDSTLSAFLEQIGAEAPCEEGDQPRSKAETGGTFQQATDTEILAMKDVPETPRIETAFEPVLSSVQDEIARLAFEIEKVPQLVEDAIRTIGPDRETLSMVNASIQAVNDALSQLRADISSEIGPSARAAMRSAIVEGVRAAVADAVAQGIHESVESAVRESVRDVQDVLAVTVRDAVDGVACAVRDAVAPVADAVRSVEERIAGLTSPDLSPIFDRLDDHAKVLDGLLDQARSQSAAEGQETVELRDVLQSSVKRIREGLCRLQQDLAELKEEAESVPN